MVRFSLPRTTQIVGLIVALVGACACTFETRIAPDAGTEPNLDASVDAAPPPDHLLLSEIKTSDERNLREFIEIFNPTAQAIDISNHYLADTALYARVPEFVTGGSPSSPMVASDDFIVRFPDGASIEAGGIIVVALRSNAQRPFAGADYAVNPSDETPRMREAFAASISSVPELDNDDGEGIALFRWDGETDLVTDIDLFNAGFRIAAEDALADKSGLSIDGPDADSAESTYADDAMTMPLPIRSNGLRESFVRIELEVGELKSGGNGSDGHDETSEDIRVSWGFAPSSPGSSSLSESVP